MKEALRPRAPPPFGWAAPQECCKIQYVVGSQSESSHWVIGYCLKYALKAAKPFGALLRCVALDRQIDRLVDDLYGLTEQEALITERPAQAYVRGFSSSRTDSRRP